MQVDTSHSLEINLCNIESNLSLQFPLAFLKGTLKCSKCSLIDLNGFIFVNGSEDEKWPVINGQFKILYRLGLGNNEIILEYCDSLGHRHHTAIELVYKPRKSSKVLRLVYIVPRGDSGCYQDVPGKCSTPEIACEKIKLAALMLQTITAERLDEEGFGRKTFQLETDFDHSVVCHVYHSKYTREEIFSKTSNEIWEHLARELLSEQFIKEHVKVLAFLSCTEFRWSNDVPEKIQTDSDFKILMQHTKGYIACGTGNFAVLGSASMHSWPTRISEIYPCFTMSEPIDTKLLLDDSGFRGTYAGCYASSLGSALHELGHTFDLIHTKEGIMARGFDDIDSFFIVKNSKITGPQTGTVSVTVRNGQISKRERSHDGEAFWSRSAAVLLSGHRWFNDEPQTDDLGLPFVSGMEVHAPNGLRLIELRMDNDFVLKFWEFVKNPRPLKIYRLSYADCSNKNICIFIQDSFGHSIKQHVQF